VNQIKEHIEAIGDTVNGEEMMMSHPRRLQRNMNQVMRSMFLSYPLQKLSIMEVTFGWSTVVLPST
jgi:hypothetical protein